MRHVVGGALVLVLLSGCSGSGGPSAQSPGQSGAVASSADDVSASTAGAPARSVNRARVSGVVATGLRVPWGLAFLPDGSALVSERDTARVKRVTAAGRVSSVGRVASVDGSGEGGLLGLALSPTYAQDSFLYAYYTAGSQNVVDRMTYANGRLSGQRRIFGGIPAGAIHNGGRLAFGPDGFLYVSTGEAGRRDPAQDPQDLGGKILRITATGRPASGNPTPGSPVWSLGHRNVQGMAWDTRGRMWASEFGQNTWDELNRIVPGGNYGWPVVEGKARRAGYRDPARQWRTDSASPSGIAVASGSVFMAALRGERLWQVPLLPRGTGKPRALLTGTYGRLRTVGLAPDGSLWVLTSNRDGRGSPTRNDDRIIRLSLSS